MLIFVQHLIEGGRYDRARLTELGRLHARFEAQPGPMFADPMVRAVAERIVHLKQKLSEAIGEVRSCSGCARGCAVPSGYFDGGRCCGTATLDVFTQPEVRAMKLAGLAAPARPAEDGSEHAGCVFRGRTGCTLDIAARPARCVEYVCHELRIELEDTGAKRARVLSARASERSDERGTERFERIQSLRRELRDTFARFEELTR